MPSPHVDPTFSPFHNPSPSPHHDTEASSSERDIEAAVTKMTDIEPFSLAYQRGHRHVFASNGVKGAMPSSSAKQVDKGKEKATKPIIVEEDDKHEIEKEF